MSFLVLFMLYFQKRGCDATISNEFQFEEDDSGRHFMYKSNIDNVDRCLGVDPGCDATLKLITKSRRQDRRCHFEKLPPQ